MSNERLLLAEKIQLHILIAAFHVSARPAILRVHWHKLERLYTRKSDIKYEKLLLSDDSHLTRSVTGLLVPRPSVFAARHV